MIRLACAFLLLVPALCGEAQRVVILKADGVPGGLVERMLAERDPDTGKSALPWIEHVFVKQGVWVRHFYSRGVSLSVPAWSVLDTGRPMAIRGNVEYDRYTLRALDYLNFIPFYFKSAFSKTADMPGVEVLDDLGITLLSDRFARQETHQSFQLYQRGIRWNTLQRAARRPFPLTSPRELLDEWLAGFELSRALQEEMERELIAALSDPGILYLDLFNAAFDHTAHLDNSEKAQRRVLTDIDRLAGRVWSAIEQSPLAAHTLLVLVSDHGMNTAPRTYSQGYNLVELLRSAAGGSHHVVTNRHPLTEYKLRGLYPFVHKVFSPAESSPYASGSPKEYPTALLDLDGNERAGIYLRNSELNRIHLLLQQFERPDLPPPVRQAAAEACREAIQRYAESSAPRREQLWDDLESLRVNISKLESRFSGTEGRLQARRRKARARSWRTDERAYRNTLAAMERLAAAQLDPPPRASRIIPRRHLGEPNTIHHLQNYVAAVSPAGLQLAPDGALDHDRSFRRIDYFSLLTGLTVRNVVQEGVGNRPVDFLAVRAPAEALSPALPEDDQPVAGVWLYGGDERQLLILARGDPLEFKVLPVARLRQDEQGRIEFEPQEWRPGLPLELIEDEDFAVPETSRRQWLSEWHSERDWRQASHRARYSNAVIGLFDHFRRTAPEGPRTNFHWTRRELAEADLLLLARDHWNFNVRGFNPGGNHGAFFRASAHAVLLLAGGEATGVSRGVTVEEPYDALSFVPTLLGLMGRCEPDLPGEIIREAGRIECAGAGLQQQ